MKNEFFLYIEVQISFSMFNLNSLQSIKNRRYNKQLLGSLNYGPASKCEFYIIQYIELYIYRIYITINTFKLFKKFYL